VGLCRSRWDHTRNPRPSTRVIPRPYVHVVPALANAARAERPGEVEAARRGPGILRSAVEGITGTRGRFAEDVARIKIPTLAQARHPGCWVTVCTGVGNRPAHNLVGVVPLECRRSGETDDRAAEVTCTVRIDCPGQLQKVDRSPTCNCIVACTSAEVPQP